MKKGLIIALSIILILGSGILGYYLGCSKSQQSNNDTNTENITAEDIQESKEFSALGEKVNTPIYTENFESIKIGSIAKEKSSLPGQPFVEDYSIDCEREDLQFQITTNNLFPEYGDITVKAYNMNTSSLVEENLTLNLRRGENTLCCYPVPQSSSYEILFYYDNSLVKVLNLIVE
jgi:hypothetical protein